MKAGLEVLGQSEELWELVRTDVTDETEPDMDGEVGGDAVEEQDDYYEDYWMAGNYADDDDTPGSLIDLTLCWFQLSPEQRMVATNMCYDYRSWDFDVLCACVDRDDLLADITKHMRVPLEDCAMEIGYHPTFTAPPRRLANKCDQPLMQTLLEVGADEWMFDHRDISDMNLTHVCPVSCGGCPTTCERPICEDYKPIVVESRWQTYRENCQWSEIEDANLKSLLKNMGWDQKSWKVRHFPWQMTLCYSQLSQEMKGIAAELCYTQESWEANCLCVDRDDFFQRITKGAKREVTDCKKDFYWNRDDFEPGTVCDMTVSEALRKVGSEAKMEWDLDTFKVKDFCPASCKRCERTFMCKRPDCSKMEWSPIVNSFWQTFLEECKWMEIDADAQFDLEMLGWEESRWDIYAPAEGHVQPIGMSLCWDQLGPEMLQSAENFCFDAQSWDTLVKCRSCTDRDDVMTHVTEATSEPMTDCGMNEDYSFWGYSYCDSTLEEALKQSYEDEEDIKKFTDDLQLFGQQPLRNFCKVSCNPDDCKPSCDRPVCKDFDTPDLAESFWETFRENCYWEDISLNMQVEMIIMGWTEDNWGYDESPDFATYCWGQMSSEQQLVLENLCFNEYTWDKFVRCDCKDLNEEICESVKEVGDLGRLQCGMPASDVMSNDNIKGTVGDHCPLFCNLCFQEYITTNGPEIRQRIITQTKVVTEREYLNSGYKTPAILAITILFTLLVLWVYCQNFGTFEVRRKFDPNLEPDTPQFGNLRQQAEETELAVTYDKYGSVEKLP